MQNMVRITVTLTEVEVLALRELARREQRPLRQQAALVIRLILEREGLLEKTPRIEEATTP